MLHTGAGWLLLAGILALLVWSIVRARKGYAAVQTLMARVDAEANATAQASATNSVHLAFGGGQDVLDLSAYPGVTKGDVMRLLAALGSEAEIRRIESETAREHAVANAVRW